MDSRFVQWLKEEKLLEFTISLYKNYCDAREVIIHSDIDYGDDVDDARKKAYDCQLGFATIHQQYLRKYPGSQYIDDAWKEISSLVSEEHL